MLKKLPRRLGAHGRLGTLAVSRAYDDLLDEQLGKIE
jgi:hypothetical protein